MKRLFCLLTALALVLCLAACGGDGGKEDGKLRIIASSFPGYDLARSVAGDLAEVSLLLPPGTESHSYEPTPRDILNVQGCDLFIYLGGESDAWVDTILNSLDTPVKTLKMLDCVSTLKEEPLEGMEEIHDDHDHDHGKGQVVEVDEHVWTSPVNAGKIAERISAELTALDSANASAYAANEQSLSAELTALDGEFRAFLATVADPVMVFVTGSPCATLRRNTASPATRPSPAALPRRSLLPPPLPISRIWCGRSSFPPCIILSFPTIWWRTALPKPPEPIRRCSTAAITFPASSWRRASRTSP